MKRRIVATLVRGLSKDKVWTRYYQWMDTAIPRAIQLALQEGAPGDVVEFASTEFGFQLAIIRLHPKGRCELEVSELAKTCPHLLHLIAGTW